MTDREPDDLYDALRDRLAHHGQEPPAQLWAGIRAQLPPPVAQPQLRRRRRWSSVLMLSLLLIVAGGLGWQWWRTTGSGQAPTGQHQVANTGENVPAATEISTARLKAPDAPTPPATTSAKEVPAKTEDIGTSIAAAEVDYSKSSRTTTSLNPSAAPATSIRPETGSATVAGADRTGSTSKRRKAAQLLAGRVEGRPYTTRAALAQEAGMARKANRRGKPFINKPSAATAYQPTNSRQTEQESQKAHQVAVSTAPVANTGLAKEALGIEAGAAVAQAPVAPALTVGAVQGTTGTEAVASSTSLLAVRPVGFMAPSFTRPEVLVGSDSIAPLPAVVVRRWAAQILAGPSLTHRQLGTAPSPPIRLSYTPPRSNSAPTDLGPNQLAVQEKASTGFGVEVRLSRVLSGRWSVSGGLGYQEYASVTAYPGSGGGIKSPGPSPSSAFVPPVPGYSSRDTYRFATVPVRFGYALGQANSRLRYGLVAGADAAWYLGGRSAGTRLAPQIWGRNDSPYRPLSLSLSAGLDLRYRLASRLELMAQPTATRFMNSLPKNISGLTPRYLLGAGVLFGVSYSFR